MLYTDIFNEQNPLETIKKLYAANSRILTELDEQGLTLLHAAAIKGKGEVVSWLIQQGININVLDKHNHTAFYHALQHNRYELASYFVQNGAVLVTNNDEWFQLLQQFRNNSNNDKHMREQVFLAAVSRGLIGLASEMIEKYPELKLLQSKNNNGFTAFLIAAANGQIEMANWLLLKNEEVLNNKTYDLKTAFLVAAQYGQIEFAKWLLQRNKLAFNNKGQYGKTAFLIAAQYGQIEFAKWLYNEHTEMINDKTDDGFTAFLMAAQYGQIEFAKWLRSINSLAHLDRTTSGSTALLIAGLSNFDFADWLLTNNYASLDERNADNQTIVNICASMYRGDENTKAFIRMVMKHCLQQNNFTFLAKLADQYYRYQYFQPIFVEILQNYISAQQSNMNYMLAMQAANIGARYSPDFFGKLAQEIFERAVADFGFTTTEVSNDTNHPTLKSLLSSPVGNNARNRSLKLLLAELNNPRVYRATQLTTSPQQPHLQSGVATVTESYYAMKANGGVPSADYTEKFIKEWGSRYYAVKNNTEVTPVGNNEYTSLLLQLYDEFRIGNKLRAHQVIANYYQKCGMWVEAYNSYSAILSNPEATADIKEAASLAVAQLFLDGQIVLQEEVNTGIRCEQLPGINTRDDEYNRIRNIERARNNQDIVSKKAIVAYQFVFPYQTSDLGKQLMRVIRCHLAGKINVADQDQAVNPRWLPQNILEFQRYYGREVKNLNILSESFSQVERALKNQEDEIKHLQTENARLRGQSERTGLPIPESESRRVPF